MSKHPYYTVTQSNIGILQPEIHVPEKNHLDFTNWQFFSSYARKVKARLWRNLIRSVIFADSRFCDVIIRSGYRPTDVNQLAEAEPKLKDDVTRFKEMYSKPLSLQQLAANAVRTRLQPNAVVGAKRLVEEGEISRSQAVHLTLGVTKDDMDTWK